MSTATDPGPQPVEPSAQAATIALPDFFPPSLIVRQLSEVRQTQPVAALASANQHRAELTDVFLQAMERGVADPRQDFTSDGMLFNYAAYFLAKWRETRARPLFLRWFALPGEDAFELGGDTVTHDGARFLASVCGGEMAPLQQLIQTREAHPACRGQAIRALALLVAWGELSANDVESCLGLLASEGLERQPSQTWNDLAVAVLTLECRSLFSELRRAATEGLIDPALAPPESGQGEEFPPGALLARFAELNPPITDVINDTRWWAGFQREESPGAAGQTYIAPPKVGRNDLCPCGSGKKFKKCCGA